MEIINCKPMAQRREKNRLQRMQSDKRTLYRRNYLIKKNGKISRELTILELSPYQFMLEKQGGVCAICKKTCSSGKSLAIDHDHDTDEVRGLLCGKCNRGLGIFNDSSHILLVAAKYLQNYGK